MHHEPSLQLVIQLQAFPKCTIDVDHGLKPDGIHSSLSHGVAVACGGSSESTEKRGGGDSGAGGEHLIMYKWDSCWRRGFVQIVGSSSMYIPLL
jgi:hypothetical protein